jgi:hypothetical protein
METLLNGKMIDVFEAIVDKTYANANAKYSAGFYSSQHMATEVVNKQGYVARRKALEVKNENGTIVHYLLEEASVNQAYDEEAVSKAGLAKLTEEEKFALGIVEFEE